MKSGPPYSVHIHDSAVTVDDWEGNGIAMIESDYDDVTPEAIKHAEYIVRVLNSHTALVAQLSEAVRVIELSLGGLPLVMTLRVESVLLMAKAALASAKGFSDA